MIRKIIIGACLFLSAVSFAQDGTSSPYSLYGIGEPKFGGTIESRSMGGLSIAQDSTHLNLQNPAGIANLKFTTFTIGGSGNHVKLKDDTGSAKTSRTTLDYMALGIPLGKFGAAFGLMPISSVGYKVNNYSADNSQNSSKYKGTGGVNKVFLGFGYKINSNFSLGAQANYNFGVIQTNSVEFAPYIINGTSETYQAKLSGINYNLGIMYNAKINKKLSFFSSLYYTPESTLRSENTRTVTTVTYDLQPVSIADEQAIAPLDLKVPQKLSFGAGIGDAKKWILGAEVSMQGAGQLANTYNTRSNVEYGKSQKYSIGGFYIPNSSPYVGYTKRITYRAGLKYEKTGLIINSTSINDTGLSLGLGLPITGTLSNLNLGIELGKKGTTSAGLVKENYFNISIGLSLNDKWFVKRKFY
jgi:hypothetical protein